MLFTTVHETDELLISFTSLWSTWIFLGGVFIQNSVVRYLRYHDRYRKYQHLDNSIEEVSIYSGTTIPPSIVMIPVLIRCSLQLNRSTSDSYCSLRDSNEKARHIKAC